MTALLSVGKTKRDSSYITFHFSVHAGRSNASQRILSFVYFFLGRA